MVRISDILKRVGQKPESKKPEEEPAKEAPQAYTPKTTEEEGAEGIQVSKAMRHKEGISEDEQKMQIAQAMRQTQPSPEESQLIYNQGLELAKIILNKAKTSEPIELSPIYSLIENIVDRSVLGDKELLSLIASFTSEDYLIAHSLNVAILSIDVGLGKGYNKSRLNELGLAAFLHDIGMINVMDIAQQPRRLSKEEYDKIKEHPFFGAELLSKIKDINQSVIYVTKEHHERFMGGGYPMRLSNGQINEYSQIVGLCDVYEALTHPRSYREAKNNHEAIKEILSLDAKEFDTKNIKILIKRLGLFPVGSWVELNSGEIGKVVSSNEEFPLRPVVNVIFGMDRQKYPEVKSINLNKQHSIYIRRSVDLKDLGLTL